MRNGFWVRGSEAVLLSSVKGSKCSLAGQQGLIGNSNRGSFPLGRRWSLTFLRPIHGLSQLHWKVALFFGMTAGGRKVACNRSVGRLSEASVKSVLRAKPSILSLGGDAQISSPIWNATPHWRMRTKLFNYLLTEIPGKWKPPRTSSSCGTRPIPININPTRWLFFLSKQRGL